MGVSHTRQRANHVGEAPTPPARINYSQLLAHPNIASKHWIIRQYDHEVQGGSVIKPLIGPLQIGPSDAAVIRPKLDAFKGVAIACGFAPQIEDPYEMAIASIDEAIRNAVCVGASLDSSRSSTTSAGRACDDEITMGTLVARVRSLSRRGAGVRHAVHLAARTSLHNQFTNSETGQVIRIPRTLLISAIGVIDDVRSCVTMDLKDPREGMLCRVRSRAAPRWPSSRRRIAPIAAPSRPGTC